MDDFLARNGMSCRVILHRKQCHHQFGITVAWKESILELYRLTLTAIPVWTGTLHHSLSQESKRKLPVVDQLVFSPSILIFYKIVGKDKSIIFTHVLTTVRQ